MNAAPASPMTNRWTTRLALRFPMARHMTVALVALVALGAASACAPNSSVAVASEEEEVTELPVKHPDAAPPGHTTGAPIDASAAATDGERDAGPQAPVDAGAVDASGPCTSDSDCTTWSSYCKESPCTCAAQRAGQVTTCAGRTVSCYGDPCATEVARCVAGACALR